MELKTPRELAEQRMYLAHEFALLGERLAEIRLEKATNWPKFRQEAKSIVEADRQWEHSDLGVEEYSLKLKIKACEQKINAVAGYLRVMEGEAKNQY